LIVKLKALKNSNMGRDLDTPSRTKGQTKCHINVFKLTVDILLLLLKL
jgi:hypothetical protein